MIAEAISRAEHGQTFKGRRSFPAESASLCRLRSTLGLIVDETGRYLRWTFSRQ